MLSVLPHVLCCPSVAVHVHQSCWCAGNGDSSSASPAAHPNPAGDAADPPAVGASTFPSPGGSFAFPAFAGATASSASATAEGKGKATCVYRPAGRNRAVRVKAKARGATTAGPTTTAAGPTAIAATAGAELATASSAFCGISFFAGKWVLCC